MIIDAHAHFWKFDRVRDSWITDEMKILRQDHLPLHLSSLLKDNEIDGCVAVQADQSETETFYLTELSKINPFIKGIVGWVDLQSDNIEKRLEYFSPFSIIKGWRHIVQSEPDGFLSGKKFLRGIQALEKYNYTYDLLINHQQLKPALEFVSQFPEQKFVIDHCGKPDVKNKNANDWKMYMKEMAAYPNIYCKLSGLLTEANWRVWDRADFNPYLDTVFGLFGADRLLFGSDWPVLQLSGTYRQWKNLIENYMQYHTAEEKQKVFGLNAVQFYNL